MQAYEQKILVQRWKEKKNVTKTIKFFFFLLFSLVGFVVVAFFKKKISSFYIKSVTLNFSHPPVYLRDPHLLPPFGQVDLAGRNDCRIF